MNLGEQKIKLLITTRKKVKTGEVYILVYYGTNCILDLAHCWVCPYY